MATPFIFDPRARRLAGRGPLNYGQQDPAVDEFGGDPSLGEDAFPVPVRGIFPSAPMAMMGGPGPAPTPTTAPSPGPIPAAAPAMRQPGAGLTGDDFTRAIQEATRSGAAARQARAGDEVPVARASSGAPQASAPLIEQARTSRVPTPRPQPQPVNGDGVASYGDKDLARMQTEGPSRGGFYSAKEEDVAYLPDSVYEEAGKRAQLAGQRRAIMETGESTTYPGLTKGDERGLAFEREKSKISQGTVQATRQEFGTALRKEQQDFSEAVARIHESPLEEAEKKARLSQAKELYQQAVSELALQFGMAKPRVDIGSGYY